MRAPPPTVVWTFWHKKSESTKSISDRILIKKFFYFSCRAWVGKMMLKFVCFEVCRSIQMTAHTTSYTHHHPTSYILNVSNICCSFNFNQTLRVVFLVFLQKMVQCDTYGWCACVCGGKIKCTQLFIFLFLGTFFLGRWVFQPFSDDFCIGSQLVSLD